MTCMENGPFPFGVRFPGGGGAMYDSKVIAILWTSWAEKSTKGRLALGYVPFCPRLFWVLFRIFLGKRFHIRISRETFRSFCAPIIADDGKGQVGYGEGRVEGFRPIWFGVSHPAAAETEAARNTESTTI